ncbi:helix-turn-helix transcriptional regulator [Spirosoma areae]
MSATKEQLRRLMELDKFLQKAQQWKVSELLQKLANEADIQVSERTLKDDLAFLITESKGLLINRKIGREWFWFYTDSTYSHFKKSLLPTEFSNLKKMISTFKEWGDLPFWEEIELMLSQFETRFAFDNQPNRKLIEFQKPMSRSGNQWLGILYKFIDEQKVTKILYRSLRTGKYVTSDIHPYLLKQFNNRWWLIGWAGKSMTNVALESIYEIEKSDTIYDNQPVFDPNTYFENVIGVTVNAGSAELIRLRIANESVEYLRTKPIHHTQHEENEEGTEITLKLIPNFELVQAILQYGNKIEVLEPESLRTTIGDILKDAVKIYINA